MASKTVASNDRMITTGATNPVPSAAPPQRKEINDLIEHDPIGFSLYVRALTLMKQTDQDLDASYFQIAGIHGEPYIAWQGAGGDSPASPNDGYCSHTSVLFPTWHRPYLALYEQILVKHARDAAASMSPDWQRQAEAFRLPYWDWAQKLIPPPQIMQSKDLLIAGTNGKMETFKNPFYNYKFHPIPDFSPDGSPETYRNPTFTDRVADEIRRSTLFVLNRTNSWDAMSNDRAGPGTHPELASSLEQIHNNIHNKTGGFMGDVPIAAFDPIFWMHHANVDRILAIWQAIHPSLWVTPSVVTTNSQTWNLGVGAKMDAQTPLEPFWDGKTSDSFWSSNETRLINAFGYTYPELKDSPSPAQLMALMQKLYGQKSANAFVKAASAIPSNSAEAKTLQEAGASLTLTKLADIVPDVQPVEEAFATTAKGVLGALVPSFSLVHGPSAAVAEPSAPEGGLQGKLFASYRHARIDCGTPLANTRQTGLKDWTVRVRAAKYALKSSFDVAIFLFPEDADESAISKTDSSSWFESPYYVGSVSAFVNSRPEHCANCQAGIAEDLHIEGFVNLNEAIIDISGLHSFEEEVVHPYLKKNLAWRVRKIRDGSIVPIEDIPSLEVTVWSSALLFDPGAAHLPTFERSVPHHGITADILGGSATATASI
ncbi:hypothetical protein BC629DRAFT_620630 [Irpex lacteus]|nr:hypothetical protein BC629DRAFT_620630 [Irpex lacteus]